MNLATWIEDVYCGECDEDEVFMDVKEEPSVYKIGAYCHGCNYDYGVIDRLSRSEIDHTDEVYERGEESVRDLLE